MRLTNAKKTRVTRSFDAVPGQGQGGYGAFREDSLLHLHVVPAKSDRFGAGTLVWLDAVEAQ
mgnify:CR=1 FL=1